MIFRTILIFILAFSPAVAGTKLLLHDLVMAGDTQAVAAHLPSRNIDKLDKKGNAPIHYAAANANAEITSLLLSHGANANVLNKRYQTTPLHEVARSTIKSPKQIRETTTILIKHGADPWITDTHGETPFLAAARIGNAVFVDRILTHKPVETSVLESALLIAREHSRYAVIRLLEARGIQSDVGRDSGLLAAVERGDFAVVDNLVSAGANVNATTAIGATPLMLAAENDRNALADYLIDHGADVNAKTQNGKTALHAAAERGNRAMVDALLENRANVNASSLVFGTPVNAAAKKERVILTNHLLAHGGEPATIEGGAEELFGSGLGWLLFADYHEENEPAATTESRRETAAGLLSTANVMFEEELTLNEKLRKRKKRGEAISDAIAVAVATAAVVGLEKMRQNQIRANQRQTSKIMALSDASSYADYHRRFKFYEGAMINPEVNLPFQVDFENASLTNKESISGLDVAISEYERRIALTKKLLQSAGVD